jgi:hypothetical protein
LWGPCLLSPKELAALMYKADCGINCMCPELPSREINPMFLSLSCNFNCCLSVHVDNYKIIVPTKCTSLLKTQDITICTFLSLYS